MTAITLQTRGLGSAVSTSRAGPRAAGRAPGRWAPWQHAAEPAPACGRARRHLEAEAVGARATGRAMLGHCERSRRSSRGARPRWVYLIRRSPRSPFAGGRGSRTSLARRCRQSRGGRRPRASAGGLVTGGSLVPVRKSLRASRAQSTHLAAFCRPLLDEQVERRPAPCDARTLRTPSIQGLPGGQQPPRRSI